MDKRIGLVFGMNPFHISTHSVRKLGYIKNKRRAYFSLDDHDFQSPVNLWSWPYTYTCKNRGKRSVGSIVEVETNKRTDRHDRLDCIPSMQTRSVKDWTLYRKSKRNDRRNGDDFYRAMLCFRGTSHGPVSACPCLSVSVSVTSRSSTKKAKHKQHHTIAQGL